MARASRKIFNEDGTLSPTRARIPRAKAMSVAAGIAQPFRARITSYNVCYTKLLRLTMRFGDFVAVDHVSFRIGRGEIFGFLGSNGCGKTTTMKMLTGLLEASDGEAWLFGKPVDARDIDTRRRVGYMSQSFSLYGELSVRRNLELHARLFGMEKTRIA